MDNDVDGEWFRTQLRARNRTITALAAHLGIDKSSASRMLSGERKMQTEEMKSIATFLSVPLSEVLKHAGLAVDLDGVSTGIILTSTIDAEGRLRPLPTSNPLPQAIIDRARLAFRFKPSQSIIAAQVRADDGPLSPWDDAIFLFSYTSSVEQAAIGSLAICKTFDGGQILAKIERARKTGEARIIPFGNKPHEVMLQTATPVMIVLP